MCSHYLVLETGDQGIVGKNDVRRFAGAVWMHAREPQLKRCCVYECVRNCQSQITVTIKRSKTLIQARSSDQDRILDDQDFDPGRGQFHRRRVLGDNPLERILT